MSRVGKLPVAIPSGVTIELDGNTVKAKGAKGELSFTANDNVKVEQGEEGITVTPIDDSVRRVPTGAPAALASTTWLSVYRKVTPRN